MKRLRGYICGSNEYRRISIRACERKFLRINFVDADNELKLMVKSREPNSNVQYKLADEGIDLHFPYNNYIFMAKMSKTSHVSSHKGKLYLRSIADPIRTCLAKFSQLTILLKVHRADETTLLGPIGYLNKQTVHKKKGVKTSGKKSCKRWNFKISDMSRLKTEEFKNILVTLLASRFYLNSNIKIMYDIV
ncbi:hypothetical protein V1478_004374 [Vespula squamosa]|uniref:Uncharacterized protein n=1 Tax=Vespula squamosa TaxID=30214 RepID=A0ABD2BHK6_VESSQ